VNLRSIRDNFFSPIKNFDDVASAPKYFAIVLMLLLSAVALVLIALPKLFQNPIIFLSSAILLVGAAFVATIAMGRIWAYLAAAIRFRRLKSEGRRPPASSREMEKD
jgi:hypothetical protein